MQKPELLSPAGSLSKLKTAIAYGADAVYIGGDQFSLRVAAENFTSEQMKEGIEFAHQRGKKVYVAANVLAHNENLDSFGEYIRQIELLGADAVIVSDLGMFSIAKEQAKNLEIHVSTQANITNYAAANAWYKLGAKRVVLARELSYEEILTIRKNTPPDLELEIFVHGAMCISYSGRCLLSNYLASRDSNAGNCAQSCRWKYYLSEEKRPHEYMPIEEDARGTYIFNSKDLCLLEHMKELYACGACSFKIEGRVKNEYYVAVVTKAYRNEMDRYEKDPPHYEMDPNNLAEVSKVSHRLYTTGFFLGKPQSDAQVYGSSSYIREYEVVALVRGYDPETKLATLEQRNRIFDGDEVEFINPDTPNFCQVAKDMKTLRGEPVEVTNHAAMEYTMPVDYPVGTFTIVRKKKDKA